MKNTIFIILSGLLAACNPAVEPVTDQPQEGIWRGAISLNDSTDLPFNFKISHEDSAFTATIFNGEEAIEIKEISRIGDSIKFQMPVFANYLIVYPGEEKLTGFYINPDADNYRLPFLAVYGDSARFPVTEANCCDINRKWAVEFNPQDNETDPAIAYFEQEGTKVEGTFMTETGDYRYLQGVLSGDQLRLSTFNGSDLYYFEATIEDGQKMSGRFYSGRSRMEYWMAYRDDDFKLGNADSLTYLKEGYERFDFSFKNLDGETVSLDDPAFEGKPVVVQIMGSWCPNCMDESRYLNDVYEKYHADGLEIVGLTFERARDEATAKMRARKMVNDLQIPYPVLLAGATRDDNASEVLPSLNHVMSFPTTIYLNRDHTVRKIHTGFKGPGTPVYEQYVSENEIMLEEMVYGDKVAKEKAQQ